MNAGCIQTFLGRPGLLYRDCHSFRSKDGLGWVGLAGLDGHGPGLRRGKPCVSAAAGRLRNSQRPGSARTPALLTQPQACLPAATLPQGVPYSRPASPTHPRPLIEMTGAVTLTPSIFLYEKVSV